MSEDKDLHTFIEHVKDSPNFKYTWKGGGNCHSKINKPQQQSSEKQECYKYGGQHNPSDCLFRQYECQYCKKRGHLAKVCRQKRDSHSLESTHFLEEEKVGEYGIFQVNPGKTKHLYATVIANGNPLSMEVDTIASVSIASLETFKTIRNGDLTLQLEDSTVNLQNNTVEIIRTCGCTKVKVAHYGQTLSLPLIVTEAKGPTLLGRKWLKALQLDWRKTFMIGSSHTLQSALQDHADVFKDELGKLQGVKARIYVEDGAEC